MRRPGKIRAIVACFLSMILIVPMGNTLDAQRSDSAYNASGFAELGGLGVEYADGYTDVIIAVKSSLEASDFILADPDRVIIDVHGASVARPAPVYDGKVRGGILNLRAGQYQPGIARVVIDVAYAYRYVVIREKTHLRVRLHTGVEAFEPWYSSAHTRAISAVAPREAAGSDLNEVANASLSGKALTQQGSLPSTSLLRPEKTEERRITVTYNDADIRDVIAAFATFAGRTIVVGRDVSGTISAEIKNQPWDVALRAILQGHGFAAAENPVTGIMTVDSYSNVQARQSLEPLITRLVPVNYGKADSLAVVISKLLARDCFQSGEVSANGSGTNCITRGAVASNPSTNTLIITETPSRIDQIVDYLKNLDVRTPQVAIKAKIIFVNRTDIENLGISYDIGTPSHYMNQLAPRPVPGGGSGTQAGDQIFLGGNTLAAIANANNRVSSPALSLIYSAALGKYSITAFLDALQEVRLADLQAEPSIVTVDNREAVIQVGQDVPVRVLDVSTPTTSGGTGSGVPRATVSFRPVGIILKVTPHITNNRQILLDVHAENSDAQIASSDVGYVFNKQSAINRLIVRDGETAVIGGLTVTQVSETYSGIPLLSQIPILGRLFRTSAKQTEKRDLLILITPHIVDDGETVVLSQ